MSKRIYNYCNAFITASTTSWVVLVPPRSFVLYLPSKMTRFTALSNRSANTGNWRCLSIIAEERRSATGLAFFSCTTLSLPTFPAEAPCSNTAWSAPTLPAKTFHPWIEIFKLKVKVALFNNHFYLDTLPQIQPTGPTQRTNSPIYIFIRISILQTALPPPDSNPSPLFDSTKANSYFRVQQDLNDWRENL